MKAQVTTISTTSIRRFRRGVVGLAVLLVLAAAGVGLALALRGGVPSAPAVVPAINNGIPAPLDVFDRHPALLAPPVGARAPLDAHERHMTTNTGVPAALDLHDRHTPANVGTPAALDLHERHP